MPSSLKVGEEIWIRALVRWGAWARAISSTASFLWEVSVLDPFAPGTHSGTVTGRELEVWIPVTWVTSVHFEELVVWTSALFSRAYFSIAAGVFVERSAVLFVSISYQLSHCKEITFTWNGIFQEPCNCTQSEMLIRCWKQDITLDMSPWRNLDLELHIWWLKSVLIW